MEMLGKHASTIKQRQIITSFGDFSMLPNVIEFILNRNTDIGLCTGQGRYLCCEVFCFFLKEKTAIFTPPHFRGF